MKIHNFLKTLMMSVTFAMVFYPNAWADDCEQGYVRGFYTGDCIPASGECGDNCSYTLDSQGNLIVSGTGTIRENAFDGNLDIISAKINEGILGFGYWAFKDTSNMTSIDIADSATSFSNRVFQGSSIKSIVLPKATSTVDLSIVMESPNIQEIILPEGLTRLNGGMWLYSSGITNLVVPESVKKRNDVINPGNATVFCTQEQVNNNICPQSAKIYERDENNNLVVYNKDGTINGIYTDYTSITRDAVVDSYEKENTITGVKEKYDGRGNLLASYVYNDDGSVSIRDANGKLIGLQGKRIFTVNEATALVSKNTKNTFTLKYR